VPKDGTKVSWGCLGTGQWAKCVSFGQSARKWPVASRKRSAGECLTKPRFVLRLDRTGVARLLRCLEVMKTTSKQAKSVAAHPWRVEHSADFATIWEMMEWNQMISGAPDLLAFVRDMAQCPVGDYGAKAKELLAKHGLREHLDGAPVAQRVH